MWQPKRLRVPLVLQVSELLIPSSRIAQDASGPSEKVPGERLRVHPVTPIPALPPPK